ncbi:MAG: hypothetical protein PHP82_01125 [Candidatus ainarchaeum sp.]|nr:hypothetical protein [Candidatus ainarchaeum sp.]
MHFIRKIKEKIFRKKIIKPKKIGINDKLENGLRNINATPEEKIIIQEMMKSAFERVEKRRIFRAKGTYLEDEHNIELTRQAFKLLGKKRAKKFFNYMNN